VVGPVVGAAGFVAAVNLVDGLWGFAVGFAVFLGCSWICDRLWRRHASQQEIREDLEDRVRNNFS
jgi:UDP-N-acetylmuramyl pentapeptide phosphotransferase/UDP-N-acetylglucosamine-1-phosphate transferase